MSSQYPQGSITFTRYGGTNRDSHIFSIKPNGSGEQQLTRESGVQAHGSLAPDGAYLVYSQVTQTGSSIKSIDLTSKEAVVLSGDYRLSMVPNVSPNGKEIAFTSDNDGWYNIYTMHKDGSQINQLTFSKDPDRNTKDQVQNVGPKYSPNGQQLLFASNRDEADRGNYQNLWLMPVQGGVAQRLSTNLNNRESRSWSPDGNRIVSQTIINNIGQLVVMDADGSNQQLITNIPDSCPTFAPGSIFPEMRGAVTPAWSPDGEWIAFASNHEGNYDLYLIRPDGGDMHRILATPEHELSVGWGTLAGEQPVTVIPEQSLPEQINNRFVANFFYYLSSQGFFRHPAAIYCWVIFMEDFSMANTTANLTSRQGMAGNDWLTGQKPGVILGGGSSDQLLKAGFSWQPQTTLAGADFSTLPMANIHPTDIINSANYKAISGESIGVNAIPGAEAYLAGREWKFIRSDPFQGNTAELLFDSSLL
jgi:TolB protein